MKYISVYFFTALAFISLCIGFNWFIDPFGMYWSPVIANINKVKPDAGNRTRITKAYRANRVKPNILLVGNSRVEMGLDPNSSLFKGQIVYNQGMPGAGLKMQLDYARDVMAVSPELQTLIIGVDYLDFLQKVEVVHQPQRPARVPGYWPRLEVIAEPSINSKLFRLKEKSSMLFSLDALIASINTMFKQGAMKSSISPLGFNTAKTYQEILLHEGVAPLYIQKLEDLKKGLRNKNLSVQVAGREEISPRRQLNDFLHEAVSKNLNVHLFISPYHYSYLQLLDELGYREDFLKWKQQLVMLVGQYPETNVQLWDFSKLNAYTLEQVPVEEKHQMSWYWEPAHYKKELGDLVLERMLGKNVNLDFGVRITHTNIASSLQQDGLDLDNSRQQWQQLKVSLGID